MGKGAVWLFAFGAIVVTIVAAYIENKLALGGGVQAGVNLGLFGTMGYFGVYLTKASKGGGILAFLVSSLVFAVLIYVATTMLFASAGAQAAAQAGANADTARAAQAVGSAVGGIAGAFVAVVALIISFLAGMIGCLIGGAAKNKALGSSASSPARAAA
jgi:hypothetical protein